MARGRVSVPHQLCVILLLSRHRLRERSPDAAEDGSCCSALSAAVSSGGAEYGPRAVTPHDATDPLTAVTSQSPPDGV